MKKVDYLILVVFSVVVLIASIIVILLSLGWVDMNFIGRFLSQAISGAKTSNIVIAISAILSIMAVKGIFFTDIEKESKSKESGVLMENGNGKLMISKATLESLVNSVVKGFDSAENIKTIIDVDANNNLNVLVNMEVGRDVIIKELTLNIQNKIKDAIKKTSDLDVKEVNVKIRNIATENKESKKRED